MASGWRSSRENKPIFNEAFFSTSRSKWSVQSISMGERIRTRPHLSLLALISFISAFIVARTFTALYPTTIWEIRGLHIHHFWYGLAMLAIGGWLGISIENERLNRVAAVLFGAGGGIIGDEVGLLLTLGNYWTEITYAFIIAFLAFVSILVLLVKYAKPISTEFTQFLRTHASIYFGVFLLAVSVSFISETENPVIITVSGISAITACVIILAYFIQRMRKRQTHSC